MYREVCGLVLMLIIISNCGFVFLNDLFKLFDLIRFLNFSVLFLFSCVAKIPGALSGICFRWSIIMYFSILNKYWTVFEVATKKSNLRIYSLLHADALSSSLYTDQNISLMPFLPHTSHHVTWLSPFIMIGLIIFHLLSV